MRRPRITTLAMILFFLIMGAVIVWINSHKPRILVLHSYDSDYVWTQDVTVGLERVLNGKNWFSVRHHYMKTNKFNDEENLRRASIAGRRVVDEFQPDVLLAIDDHAQQLVAMHYVDRAGISIVFAGINGTIEPYNYHVATNVTGILERKQVAAIREAILMIDRQQQQFRGDDRPVRAVYLYDPAYSAKQDADYLASFAGWGPIDYQGGILATNFDEWQRIVKDLAGKVDYLLVSGYRNLPRSATNRTFVKPEEVMRFTEANSTAPVIGMNVFNTKDGAMLSIGVSPYEQGETSAGMALEILGGEKKPRDIPLRTARQYVIALRNGALRQRHISVPQMFEAFARATNNYYE